jgi:hypothetical protein
MTSIRCPRCGEKVGLRVSNDTKTLGKKYYSHEGGHAAPLTPLQKVPSITHGSTASKQLAASTANTIQGGKGGRSPPCAWFAWADELMLPKIFIASKLDYPLKISNQSLLKASVREQLLAHKISRKGYLQTGRFVPTLDNTAASSTSMLTSLCSESMSSMTTKILLNSGELIDLDYDSATCCKPIQQSCKSMFEQIANSDLLFAVITETGQYQVVAEAHHALSLGMPVFIKFCNCDQYDVWSYRFLIDAVRFSASTAEIDWSRYTLRLSETSSKTAAAAFSHPIGPLFRSVDVLASSWVSEKDYLEYLETIPICCYCFTSYSKRLMSEVRGREVVVLEKDDSVAGDEGGDLQLESVEMICSHCKSALIACLTDVIYPPCAKATATQVITQPKVSTFRPSKKSTMALTTDLVKLTLEYVGMS